MEKDCSKCGEVKPYSEFNKKKSSKDGYQPKCKKCEKEYYQDNRDKIIARTKAYNKDNKDKIIAYQKEYYQDNIDKIKVQHKAYKEDNRDKINARNKAYREANRDNLKAKAKEYYQANKDKVKVQHKAYYQANNNKIKTKHKAYREANRDKINAYQKEYREDNKDKIIAYQKEYYQDNRYKLKAYREANKDKINAYQKEYSKTNRGKKNAYVNNRRKTDHLFRLRCSLGNRTRMAIKRQGYTKKSKTHEMLGIDYDRLVVYLERQFKKGMTWDNYGEWHIDHIIPLSSAKSEQELLKLCHYTNLQPLWAIDNMAKGNKIEETQILLRI